MNGKFYKGKWKYLAKNFIIKRDIDLEDNKD
jgi:hypothetical protein